LALENGEGTKISIGRDFVRGKARLKARERREPGDRSGPKKKEWGHFTFTKRASIRQIAKSLGKKTTKRGKRGKNHLKLWFVHHRHRSKLGNE